ncbi:MAG: hypothetical protein ACD_15C00202G0012 [uncultured bacterium]|nr:MAG: hypothetical protein ACD_15C00202G0012 [uncultured bacterium]
MSIYKFEETVRKIAQERGVEIIGSNDRAVWQIKKDLENKKITPDEVPEKLKEQKDFRLKFSRDDFEAVVRAIK